MNWPPAALVAGVFVIGLAVGFVLAFGLWRGRRSAERVPPTVTVAVVAAHQLIGAGLIWYAVEPARWLRTVLVVLVVPVTFAVLLSVAVIGFKQETSWAAGDDERRRAKKRELGEATLFGGEFQNPSRPFGWLLAAAISWLVLGFAVAPPGSYRPPDFAAQTPSWLSWAKWLAIMEDLYQAGATLVIVVGAVGLTAEAYRRRKWADATGDLGCLSLIAIFIFIMFLIGGWTLVGQFRIIRE